MTNVRLKVVLAFNRYRVGDVIERMPSVAKGMIAARWYGHKMVELEEPEPVVTATEPAPALATIPAQTQSEPSYDSRSNVEDGKPDHAGQRRHQRHRQRDG